jgi:uncharacterized protein DUF2637
MTGDRAIRRGTAAVVLAVAAFAAVVSYSHIYDLGRAHGQSGTAARLLPLSVDGLIVAAGLVLLRAAREHAPAPVLARCCLWLGIAATVGANVSYGAAYGPLGAIISAWPAVAFVGSAEMALGMVRASAPPPAPASEYGGTSVPAPHPNGHAAPDGAPELARLFAAELARGELPSIRRIRREAHCGQDRAQSIAAYLAVLAGEVRADA